jgi:uncharacterized protein YigE (DUF2233 family)
MGLIRLDPHRSFGSSRPLRALVCVCVSAVVGACVSSGRRVDGGLSRVSWSDSSADVYVVDTRVSRIGVFASSAVGNRLTTFDDVRRLVDGAGARLTFATNGGMFHADYSPVGLLVQDGVERSPLNLQSGEGNFYLKPNGVFLVSADRTAAIVPSEEYAARGRDVDTATQSGPLLVVDGQINAAFTPGSNSRFVRSGVGVIDPHTVVFAISKKPVNFWDFSRLFRDVLGCRNALYLDGVISRFYVPGSDEFGEGGDFGVLIGVMEIS